MSIAVDSSGNAYVTGNTGSTNFPTKNPLQAANAGSDDAFVAKINAAGSAMVYSSYLGGSRSDSGQGIAVDSTGNAYVTGSTYSTDFPTTPGAFQTVCNGGSNCSTHGDAFVTKFNPAGAALVYSTYLGGTNDDQALGMSVDGAGNVYITGETVSTDFPTMNPIQPAYGGDRDAFVAKINPTSSALVYSTYLGGGGQDFGTGIAADSAGNAYVNWLFQECGTPTCPYFPYVTKFNPTGSALVYSTNLIYSLTAKVFGTGDIAVDSAGSAYVIGRSYRVFVVKVNPAGSPFSSPTYLGGNGANSPWQKY